MYVKTVSPSSYNSYEYCQFKYYLRYDLGILDEAGPAATLGHIGHYVIETIVNQRLEGKEPDNAWDLWNQEWKKKVEEMPDTMDRIYSKKTDEVKDGLKKLLKDPIYSPYLCDPLSAEQNIEISLPEEDTKIIGKIDRVQKRKDGGIEVFDLKTGRQQKFHPDAKNKLKVADLWDDIQMQIYGYAVRELYPDAKSYWATLYYPSGDGALTIEVGKIPVEQIKDRIISYVREVRNNNNPKLNKGWWCNKICSYGRDGTCPGVYNDIQVMGKDLVEFTYKETKERRNK